MRLSCGVKYLLVGLTTPRRLLMALLTLAGLSVLILNPIRHRPAKVTNENTEGTQETRLIHQSVQEDAHSHRMSAIRKLEDIYIAGGVQEITTAKTMSDSFKPFGNRQVPWNGEHKAEDQSQPAKTPDTSSSRLNDTDSKNTSQQETNILRQNTSNVLFSSTKKPGNYKMAVGVSVAPRDPPTILRLLDEIFKNSDVEADLADTVLVIHVAFNVTIADKIHKAVQGRENVYVMEENSPHWQAEPENIPDTRGDTMERTVWRTKQVMDYAVLLRALVRFNTTYILMLEDDVKPAKNAFTKVRQVASQFDNHKDFGLMALYSPSRSTFMQMNSRQRFPGFGTGAVALMFTHFVAGKVVEMLLAKPWWYPVDLMIPPYVIQELKRGFYVHTPHLFQHVSERSTYAGEDAAKRKAETWRSPAFEFDSDNSTSALTPFEGSGYIGCFMDHNLARQRDLICQFDLQSASFIDKCRRFCQKSYYFGLQAGGECYCGNEFGQYGRVNDSRCNIPCKSANNQNCGGNGFNSVYRVKPFSATYQGCYDDQFWRQKQVHVQKKIFTTNLVNCINACGGKALIGLTNGNTCHCLNLSKGTTLSDFESLKLDNGVCNIVCPAYRGYICGGASNSVVLYQTW